MNRTAKDLIFDLSGAKQRWVELEKQLQTEKESFCLRNTHYSKVPMPIG
jgi:hypothetical protein